MIFIFVNKISGGYYENLLLIEACERKFLFFVLVKIVGEREREGAGEVGRKEIIFFKPSREVCKYAKMT